MQKWQFNNLVIFPVYILAYVFSVISKMYYGFYSFLTYPGFGLFVFGKFKEKHNNLQVCDI